MYSDGSTQLQELALGNLTMIHSDDAPNSQSITLVRYATVRSADPKPIVLQNPLYRSFDGSRRIYRCQPDNFLAPRDTVGINGVGSTGGVITQTIGERSELMEISQG